MTRIDDLLQRMATLEREIDLELDLVRSTWRYRFEKKRIRFERNAREAHRRLRRSIPRYLRESQILNVLTAPVIYAMIIPIAFLDAWVSLYQAICFRAYGDHCGLAGSSVRQKS